MTSITSDLQRFAAKADEVAALLKALGNQRRLMVLCQLAEHGEMLSQSALSQHLAVLREEGLLAFRREAQTLWYRIADPRCEELLVTLHHLYCKDD
jgi:ArsR family transcriptional regulator, virulence genes transcriptional regulator